MARARFAPIFADGANPRAVLAYAKSLSRLSLDADEQQLAKELEAMLEAMYLMAAADGEIATDELLQLSSSLRAMLEPYENEAGAELGLPLLKLDQQVECFAERLAEEGLEARLQVVAQRLSSPEARCLAFCLAAAVAFVDDIVAGGEVDTIEQFAAALGLSPEESQHLLREVLDRMR